MLRFIVIPQCDKSIFFFKERKKINLKDMNNIVGLSWVVALALGMTACTKNDTTQTAMTASSSHATSTHATSTHASMTQTQSMHHMASAVDTQSQSQPPHIMAYMDIMNKMHQAMSAGVQAKNADVGFAKGMIPHHEGAIAMAKVQLQYGKDAEMKALAQKIVDTQQSEISVMQNWLDKNESSQVAASNAKEITQAYQQKAMGNHDAMMQGIMDANPDIAFAKGIIPHHQGAIDMATIEQTYGKNPAMLALAKQIKHAQTPEIKQMQDWLSKQAH